MRILILDDNKTRLSMFRRKLIGAVVICTEHVSDCIREIEENEPFDYFYCDHDLDGLAYVPSSIGTGYEVMVWLKNNPHKKPKVIIIHSLNHTGAVEMIRAVPEALYMPGIFVNDCIPPFDT
jgi:CheY-like chemotaxis protein